MRTATMFLMVCVAFLTLGCESSGRSGSGYRCVMEFTPFVDGEKCTPIEEGGEGCDDPSEWCASKEEREEWRESLCEYDPSLEGC